MEARLTGPAPEADSKREKDFQEGTWLKKNGLNIPVFSQLNAPGIYFNLGMVDPAFV